MKTVLRILGGLAVIAVAPVGAHFVLGLDWKYAIPWGLALDVLLFALLVAGTSMKR